MANNNFVYLLIDPRTINNSTRSVFYVGRGKNQRPLDHLEEAKEWDRRGRPEIDGEQSQKKLDQILEISDGGHSVGIEILRRDLTNGEAALIESAAIDLLGLDSLTNKCAGEGAQRCSWLTYQTLRAATLQQFVDDVPAIVVPVSGVHGGATATDGMLGANSLDIHTNARKYWQIGHEKRTEFERWIEHDPAALIAMQKGTKGLVVGLWQIEGFVEDEDRWIIETTTHTSPKIDALGHKYINHFLEDPTKPGKSLTPQTGVRYLNKHLIEPLSGRVAA